MSALPKRRFTPEEYLALELRAGYRSQYVAGEIYAMAGAGREHIEITDNLTWMFRNIFGDRPCRTFAVEMRVRAERGDLWTYPDLSVVCGEPKFDTADRPHSLTNPQVIFEVLSPSTEAFDRGDKFSRYRRLDSLTDYVLVSSDKMLVEQFVRQQDGSWKYNEYNQPDTCLPLVSVGCELPLADIYRRIKFPEFDAAA